MNYRSFSDFSANLTFISLVEAYFCRMDHESQLKFLAVKTELEKGFGDDLDLKGILFLIGVNELGKGYKDFSKSEKTDLMHLAICTILAPFGFYEYEYHDPDGWPHFKLMQALPHLTDREQEALLKDAVVLYFDNQNSK